MHKIGIIGISAGGHLAETAGTHFDSSFIPDPSKINLRPDFMILVYPVISMQESFTHLGWLTSLIGEGAATEKIQYFSKNSRILPGHHLLDGSQ